MTLAAAPDLDLRDIHVPIASWWPPAPGWWVLAIVLLFALILMARWWSRQLQRRRAFAAMQVELQRLADAHADEQDNARLVAGISQLLRRVVKARGGAVQVEGDAWRLELERIGRGPLPIPLLAVVEGAGFRRQTELDAPALLHACRQWLGQAARHRNA